MIAIAARQKMGEFNELEKPNNVAIFETMLFYFIYSKTFSDGELVSRACRNTALVSAVPFFQAQKGSRTKIFNP